MFVGCQLTSGKRAVEEAARVNSKILSECNCEKHHRTGSSETFTCALRVGAQCPVAAANVQSKQEMSSVITDLQDIIGHHSR
jgi:hypothetical protein